MATRMQQRRGTATQWTTANPVLNIGEIGYETDTNQFKIGDGTNHWADLSYFVDETSLNTSLDNYVETSLLGIANGVATLNSSGVLESSQLPDISEITSDTMNDVLVASTGITKTYDDGANTITLAVDTTVIATKAELAEVAQDSVNDALTVTSGITKAYDDSANTVTLGIDSNVVATLSGTQTLLNKTFDLANNTVTGTLAQFNTALSDADFVSLAGSETLLNKTIDLGNNIIAGTLDQFNNAITDADILPTSGGTLTGFLTLHADPTQALHPATKQYVDAVSEGLHVHKSVVAASTTNITLPTAPATMDGVTLNINDRVLLKNQTAKAENGIYVVINGDLARAADYNTAEEIDAGDFVFVSGGTLYESTGWVQENNITTLGTDAIEWVQFSGAGTYLAGSGLTLTGSTFSVNIGTDVQAYSNTLTNVVDGTYVGNINLNTLGNVTTGTWSATTIGLQYGGTGATTQSGAANAILPSQGSNSGKYLTTDGTNVSWGTVSSYTAPTLGSTSIGSGATVTTISGLTLSGATLSGSLTAGGGTGTSGQVLSSTGSGVQWITPSQGAAFSELMLIGA